MTETRNPRYRTTAMAAGASLAAALLLAACGGGSSSPSTTSASTTSTTTAKAVTSACDLVTPTDIQETLNLTVGAAGYRTAANTTVCTFPPTASGTVKGAVIVGFRSGVNADVVHQEQVEAIAKYGPITNVSGKGDSAFYYQVPSGGTTITTLVAQVGTTQVTVTSSATVNQSEDLASRIFANLAAQAQASTTTTVGPSPSPSPSPSPTTAP